MTYEWFIIIFLVMCIAVMATLWPKQQSPEERAAEIRKATYYAFEYFKSDLLTEMFKQTMDTIVDMDRKGAFR